MLGRLKLPTHRSESRRKIWIPRLFGAFIVLSALFAFTSKPTAIEQLGNLLFDRYQTWQPRTYHDDIPVRVVDIDNESIARIGQWPWSRLTMARLNDRLNEAGAGVIAYDIIFSEADRTSPANLAPILSANPAGGFDARTLEGLTDHDVEYERSLQQSNSVLAFFLLATPNETRPVTRHSYGWSSSDGQDVPTADMRDYRGALTALPELGTAASGEGFTSLAPQGDGIIRVAPMFQTIGTRVFPSLSAEALRVVQGAQSFKLQGSDGSGEFGRSTGSLAGASIGDFGFRTDEAGGFFVYFAEPRRETTRWRTIPAWQILEQDDWIDRVGGNIVFVGTSADGLKDLVATPLSARYEGVNVHAEIIEQIIGEQIHGGQLLQRPYWAASVEMWMILLTGGLMVWLLPRLGSAWGALLSAGLIVGISAFSWLQFSRELILINPVYPVLSIGVTYLVMTLASFWLTEAERSRIRGAFSRYLSPDLVEKVSDNPDLLTLGGEERPMTILFLDVRSFSKISEGMEPQEIVTFLNLFLTPMTDLLQGHKATIDKYIGDAIVAFWNAPLDDPDHAANACRAVLAMGASLKDLRARYSGSDDVKWPDNLAMGIGLNTGVCCVGNLGSEQRFSYSMIGDAANLASRIEGLTKQYRVQTLIGDSTAEAAPGFALLEADRIRVVGRQTPERIHILCGDTDAAQEPDFQALKTSHDTMLQAYRSQDWDAADAAIRAARTRAQDRSFVGYYDVMEARIAEYRANPPGADWDGVFTATSK